MVATTRIQHRYDHRLSDLVRSSGDIGHATRRGVPRSTARGWLTSTRAEVVTVDVVDLDVLRLQQEVLALRQRVEWLVAMLRLVVIVLKASGFSLAGARLPQGTRKVSLLRAIDRSHSVLSLRVVFRVLRLSQSRYHSWKRADPSITAELLLSASSGVVNEKPTLLADGGVENFNSAVEELVDSGLLPARGTGPTAPLRPSRRTPQVARTRAQNSRIS